MIEIVYHGEAAAAFGNKDFAGAAAKFEEVIDKGMDDETAACWWPPPRPRFPNATSCWAAMH